MNTLSRPRGWLSRIDDTCPQCASTKGTPSRCNIELAFAQARALDAQRPVSNALRQNVDDGDASGGAYAHVGIIEPACDD